MEVERPSQFVSNLKKLGVRFDSPKVGLPLRHVQITEPYPGANQAQLGIPMVVGYETKDAPLYPPEGLFVDGTGVYDRIDGQPRFSILSNRSSSLLNGRIYPLATDHNAAGDHLKLRARHLAASGFGRLPRRVLVRKGKVREWGWPARFGRFVWWRQPVSKTTRKLKLEPTG